MTEVNITDVQYADRWGIRTYLREINDRLRRLANVNNLNQRLVWDDLRFPATGISIFGFGADPARTAASEGLLSFSATADERVFVVAQLPHAWAEGTELKPHVHWHKTTTGGGTVQWSLDYKWSSIGQVKDASWTTINTDGALAGSTPDTNTIDKHLISPLPDITTTGREISDMLVMRFWRLGTDATYDTYGGPAELLEFDIHYARDARGSVNVFNKDAN